MRDKEFIDLSNAYNQICEQSYGIDASKHGGPDKLLQKMVDEKKRRGDKDGGGEVISRGLQKANYEPEGELVLEKDETEEGITGLPIPKKKMSPRKRHEFEKKRREERKKRGDSRVGDTFSQHRMTGSRGRGSEYEVNPRVSYRHNEEYLIGYLLDEGFACDEKSAKAIANVMGEEWKQSILEMDEFSAGGGNAKMKKTGMTRDQVIALGKKNLASKPVTSPKPSSSTTQSSGSAVGSKPSDVVRDRLAAREKYRETNFRIPSKSERIKAAQDQEARYNNSEYIKRSKDPYYQIKTFKDIPGTF